MFARELLVLSAVPGSGKPRLMVFVDLSANVCGASERAESARRKNARTGQSNGYASYRTRTELKTYLQGEKNT